jgi:predicted outer membrane repeat protein
VRNPFLPTLTDILPFPGNPALEKNGKMAYDRITSKRSYFFQTERVCFPDDDSGRRQLHMAARIKKVFAVFLCALLVAGPAGGAAADGANLMERMGRAMVRALARIFVQTGDIMAAGSWAEIRLAAMKGAKEVIVTADIVYGDDQGAVVFFNSVAMRSAEGGRFAIDGNGKQMLRFGGDEDTPLAGASIVRNLILRNGDASEYGCPAAPPTRGGALCVYGDLLAYDCEFADSKACFGGAMYVMGDLTLDGCAVRNNAATDEGGGVHVEYGDLTVNGGEICGNTAITGGGLYSSDGDVAIAYSVVSDNEAKFGGGVYTIKTVTIDGGEVTSNYATRNGGGVYVQGLFVISGGTISTNEAKRYGGGVYNLGNPLTTNGGTISGNKATVNGGGIALNRCRRVGAGTLFVGNRPNAIAP